MHALIIISIIDILILRLIDIRFIAFILKFKLFLFFYFIDLSTTLSENFLNNFFIFKKKRKFVKNLSINEIILSSN
jgi:hypothetical protein